MTGKLKIVAAVLLLAGVLMVLIALNSRPAQSPSINLPLKQEDVTVSVVTAKSLIVFGEPVTADMVTIEQRKEKPEGAFSDTNDVVGRVPILSVQQGKVLTESIFEPNAVSEQVRTGHRAVAVRIDEQLAATGKLKPGDLVDVFSVFRRDDRDVSTTQARLVLPRLRVITVGPRVVGQKAEDSKTADANANPGTVRNVTLEAPVADVNLLLLAQQQGNLMLALRNAEDSLTPARTDFPEPVALLKKKDSKGKPVNEPLSPDDKAYAGIGLESVVATGGKPNPNNAAQAAPAQARSDGSAGKAKPKEDTKIEMIRGGKVTSEAAQ